MELIIRHDSGTPWTKCQLLHIRYKLLTLICIFITTELMVKLGEKRNNVKSKCLEYFVVTLM